MEEVPIEELLSALGHKDRFSIANFIFRYGPQGYNNIGRAINRQGSVFAFHLRKLQRTGILKKEGTTYVLTEKGMYICRSLFEMNTKPPYKDLLSRIDQMGRDLEDIRTILNLPHSPVVESEVNYTFPMLEQKPTLEDLIFDAMEEGRKYYTGDISLKITEKSGISPSWNELKKCLEKMKKEGTVFSAGGFGERWIKAPSKADEK